MTFDDGVARQQQQLMVVMGSYKPARAPNTTGLSFHDGKAPHKTAAIGGRDTEKKKAMAVRPLQLSEELYRHGASIPAHKGVSCIISSRPHSLSRGSLGLPGGVILEQRSLLSSAAIHL